MTIFVRIWFAFSLVLLVGSYFIVTSLQQQIKPNIRQVVEDTLAENANIIAALIADDMVNERLNSAEFEQKIQTALNRQLKARIWSHNKNKIYQTLYITDATGKVVYDSTGQATGQDYSRWNDVYLTLKGQYGARSTRSNPADENSSTMFVAAPILYQNQLIGVVSVGKAGSSVQPYIEQAQQDVLLRAMITVLVSLFLCSLVAWWLRLSIEKVRRYALGLAASDLKAPHFYSARELNELSAAIANMRDQLEDRAYVERYVHTLTHELKSPLTAIHASAELLQDELPLKDQQRFAHHIEQQSDRLQQLIERLLLLVKLEKRHSDFKLQETDLEKLIQHSVAQRMGLIEHKKIRVMLDLKEKTSIQAEPFWLGQAIGNLIDNAIDFTQEHGSLEITLKKVAESNHQAVLISIANEGVVIPDYALSQVFERYYSLPRPDTGMKSTGLGLTLVKEVMEQHHGKVMIENLIKTETQISGVVVKLYFPQYA